MKTFKDLDFKPHPNFTDGVQAIMNFDNGYGVSVVRFVLPFGGYGSYTDNDNEWEVAVMYKGALTYNTPITDDVIGHCSEEEVTKIMEQVQKLEA